MISLKTINRGPRDGCPAALLACVVASTIALLTSSASAQVAVKARTIHTMAGDAIENGVVVITDGKIAAVGPQANVEIPAGHKVLEAQVVTPGLVDAHSVVGLAGQYNYDHDQDQLDRAKPMQPQLRAIDAYNTRERLVEWVRSFGVTTVHTGHAPEELIPGQTMIVKTRGNTVDDAVIVPEFAVAATLSQHALKSGEKSPGNRSKMMAMLRQKLIDARDYLDERARGDDTDDAADEEGENVGGDESDEEDKEESHTRDLELETLGRVLQNELPLLITAHRAQDIANALRLAEEFKIRIILDGAAESYLLIDEIKAAKVSVIIHPTMMRAYEETENLSMETASKLHKAGIPIALQSGYEDYVPKTRVILFEAAIAAANGLSFDEALATITIDAAKMLGIDHRVGSIAVGKDGDLAIYDGDPFEYTTHCIGTIIEGEVVSETVR